MKADGLITLLFEPEFGNVDMARASLRGICDECFGRDDDRGADLCVAATEAMNNVVEHSGSRLVKVDILRGKGGLTLRLINDGVPFDPTVVIAGLTGEGMLERDEGGYGLYLMRELVDRFTYEYHDSCNVWVLEKHMSVT